MAKKLSEGQAQSRVIQVDAMRKQGKSVTEACREVGITNYIYGYWKRRLAGSTKKRGPYKKKRRQIQVETPAPQAQLVRIWGELSGGKMTLLSDLAA